jgi:phage FluMu gp28-like protein
MHLFSKIDSDFRLSKYFMPHQLAWILAEKEIHAQHRQVVALAEKSVRIGWTYADAFKNVRKRLWFRNRDYLFATKDYPSALEYIRQCYTFAEIFNSTRSIVSHGEEGISVNRLDEQGRPSSFTEEVKIGVIRFDNGSRIIAFSANPQAMAVYGGDVGLDEFAKHPNARLLWETAQGRVTWNYDIAVWSSHDGEDTLFNEFASEARRKAAPWNLYFHTTLTDAIDNGLVERINQARGTHVSRDQFLASCRERARDEEIFQQAYMCNPSGAAANHIVEWSAIERCRADFPIERVHLEADDVSRRFGVYHPYREAEREQRIEQFLFESFPSLFNASTLAGSPEPCGNSALRSPRSALRLGFDVAASGQGNLSVFYIDEVVGRNTLQLRALLTCRTEDWHFLTVALHGFLGNLRNLQAAGDESGLGRQICWEAAKHFSSRFQKVNFRSEKNDLGFLLMTQLSVAEKRIPRGEQDIASDYFALRKTSTAGKWSFSETRNPLNPASHCDLAWAGALATYAHTHHRPIAGARVG